MQKLYCAVYVSRPRVGLSPFDVLTILETSRRNNAQRGVTGVLFANARTFFQWIEGPLQALNQTFRIIAADDRHLDVTLLRFGRIDARHFPEWYMRSVDAFESKDIELDSLLDGELDEDQLDDVVARLGARSSARWLGGHQPR